MKNLVTVGRLFFAVAFSGLGIQHFIFHDFISGRAPAWPDAYAGRLIWAYLSGVFFIGISLAIISGKHARAGAILAATLIFVWALLRHIPDIASDSFLSGTWTSAGKALVFSGGFLAIAATFPVIDLNRDTKYLKKLNTEREFIIIGKICLGVFLLITGIQHFIYTEFVASLIPVWFPGNAVFWTWFGGVALIAGGLGLLIPKTSKLAALMSGIMVFSWFWLIHIPRTFESVSDGIAVFEALAVSGLAFVLAGMTGKK